ncbi:MAG TPA: MFS transporter [Rubrivivax sp.]|nr:MFS transporter [Rubrivivax sp.]
MQSAAPETPFPAALWLIPGVYFLFVAAEFVVLIRLALTLTEQGASALAVGTLASAFWLGIFVASLLAHALVQRLGHARCFLAAMATSALAVVSLMPHAAYAGWLGGVAVMGLCGGWVWVSGEAWLAEAAPRKRRGLLIGLFETSVGLGMLAGPALLPLALWAGLPPLAVGLGLMLAGFACAWPLLGVAEPSTGDAGAACEGEGGTPEWRLLAVPLAAVAAASGLMESGVSSLLPSVAMRLGFEMQTAAWLGAFIGAGSALLQAPFGALADRIGLRRAMALAWALVLLATLALWWWAGAPQQVLWPVGFVLGGVGGAVYTLVVIELGHRLGGSALIKAMGLLVTAYTAGTAGGPLLGGWLFDRAGLPGLAGVLMACGVAGALLAWRALRHRP